MLIQKQISKLLLVEILLEMQQRFSLLQKQKKPFKIFQMLSNLQLNKVILGIKHDTKLTLSLSSNMFDDSNNENNLPHKLFLTNTHVSRLCKILAQFHQLIWSYQKLICIRYDHQEDF